MARQQVGRRRLVEHGPIVIARQIGHDQRGQSPKRRRSLGRVQRQAAQRVGDPIGRLQHPVLGDVRRRATPVVVLGDLRPGTCRQAAWRIADRRPAAPAPPGIAEIAQGFGGAPGPHRVVQVADQCLEPRPRRGVGPGSGCRRGPWGDRSVAVGGASPRTSRWPRWPLGPRARPGSQPRSIRGPVAFGPAKSASTSSGGRSAGTADHQFATFDLYGPPVGRRRSVERELHPGQVGQRDVCGLARSQSSSSRAARSFGNRAVPAGPRQRHGRLAPDLRRVVLEPLDQGLLGAYARRYPSASAAPALSTANRRRASATCSATCRSNGPGRWCSGQAGVGRRSPTVRSKPVQSTTVRAMGESPRATKRDRRILCEARCGPQAAKMRLSPFSRSVILRD